MFISLLIQTPDLFTAGTAAPNPPGSNAQSSVAHAETPPQCYNYCDDTYHTATKWLTSPGTQIGTSCDDVLVGTSGSDTILGRGQPILVEWVPDGTVKVASKQEGETKIKRRH